MPRKTDRQILDEALAQQAKGTYVDPVAEARRLLSQESVVDRASREQGMVRNPETGMWEPHAGPHVRTAGEEIQQTIGETASAMMLPLAFLSGPIGAIAGGSMALEGLKNAMDDPSALNLGLAAAGAIPGIKALRGAGRFGKAVGVGDEVAASAGKVPTLDDVINGGVSFGKKGAPVMDDASQRAAMFEDVLSRQPKPQPSGTTFDMTGNRGRVGFNRPTEFTPESPVDRYMANAPGTVTRGVEGADNIQPSVDRWAPNVSGEVTAGVEGAEQLAPSFSRFSPNVPGIVTRGVDGADNLMPSIERYAPNVPGEVTKGVEGATRFAPTIERFTPNIPGEITEGIAAGRMPSSRVMTGADQFSDVAGRAGERSRGLEARGQFNRQTPQVVDDIEDLQDVAPGADEIGASLEGLTKALAGLPNSRAIERAGRLNRLTAEAVAPARRRAGQEVAGFSDLPEMSPGELARISALMERITGR